MKELEKISDPLELALDDRLEYYILKSNCLCKLNQYPIALDLAEKGLHFAKKSGNPLSIIDVLVSKGTSQFRLGKSTECYESLQQIETIIINELDNSSKDFDLAYERFYMLSSLYYYQNLDTKKFLEINQKRLQICKKYNMIVELGEVYHNLGISYLFIGELRESLKMYKKSMEIARETNNYTQLAYCLGNTGKIYSILGDLDLALNFYDQSLEILREFNNEYLLGAFLNAMGDIYIQKGNFQKSLKYFKQGYDIVKKMGNNLNISGALFKIIENLTLQNDVESAEPYFKELEEIVMNDENRRIKINFDFAHAIILKARGGSRNLVRAGDILRSLLDIDDLKTDSLLHLKYCELLFDELEKTNEETILDEIDKTLDYLEQIANRSQSIEIRAEIKLLQAKFDLINFSFDEAQKNFVSGQKIARKYDLIRLENRISQEYDNFLLYYDEWTKMKDSKAKISKRFKFSSIDEILQIAMKNKAIENIDSTAEVSKLLEIVSNTEKSNLRFYSNNNKEGEIHLDINSIQKMFDSNFIDRIKYENNTIIMNEIGEETIYYVLEGDTFQGRQNLQNFSDNILFTQKMLENKGFPFTIKKIVEIVKNSEDLIKQKAINKEITSEILEKNDIITAPHRFNILYCLFEYGRMNWTDLKNKLKLTSGNLDYHLTFLQKKGWIMKDEEFQDRILQFIDISEYGKDEFKKYIKKISQMCQQVEN